MLLMINLYRKNLFALFNAYVIQKWLWLILDSLFEELYCLYAKSKSIVFKIKFLISLVLI